MKLPLIAVLAVALTADASAQAPEIGPTDPTWSPDPTWSLLFDVRAYDNSDLDSTGDLSLSRWSAGVDYNLRQDSGIVSRLAYEHEESSYDFGGGAVIFVSNPFEGAKEDAVSATYGTVEGERKWFFSASFHSGREQGTGLSDSYFGKVGGGILWNVNENFDLGIGLFGRTFLEDDVDVIPIPLIDWRATENLRVGIVHATDPGLGVTYKCSDQLDAYASVSFKLRQYRLEDKGLLTDAAATDEEQSLRVGLIWKALGIDAEVYGGVAWRQLTIDADDSKLGDEDVDPAGMIGFAISYTL